MTATHDRAPSSALYGRGPSGRPAGLQAASCPAPGYGQAGVRGGGVGIGFEVGFEEVTAPTPTQHALLTRFGLAPPTAPSSTERSYLAVGRGAALAAATLRLTSDAEVRLCVVEQARRCGLGTALLRTVATVAGGRGYRVLYCTATDGTPAGAFLEAHRFRTESAANLLRLRLPAPPRSVPPPTGYRLRQWTGAAPDDLGPALLAAKRHSGDLPTGAFPGDHGDPAKALHAMPKRVQRCGNILHTVAVVAGDGAIVGYTELAVVAGTGRAEQINTVVLPTHRGRALGRCLKVAMLDRIALLHPEMMEVDTENAVDNVPMLTINADLGFRLVSCTRRRWAEVDRLRG